MNLDSEQIKICLTDDQEVIDILRRRKKLRKAPKGSGEIFELQYNTVPVEFRLLSSGERTISPMPASIARALMRDSSVIVGDPLSGERRPALIEVGRYKLTEGDPNLRFSKTTCPFCRLECENPRRLAAHISQQCTDPEAQVPQFAREREEELKRKEAARAERKTGPSADRIREVIAGTLKPNTIRELPPETTTPANPELVAVGADASDLNDLDND